MFWILAVLLLPIVSTNSTCPKIISRATWGARTALEVAYLIIPVQYVVIHHTMTNPCSTELECIHSVTNLQHFHMNDMEFHDIGYNFLIGGDGSVYEGVGWHKIGAHTRNYNTKSIGIAFIGDFQERMPNRKQMEAAKKLLQCGVDIGELDRRYKLLGARQVASTQSPGLTLYREIRTWPNFVSNPGKG